MPTTEPKTGIVPLRKALMAIGSSVLCVLLVALLGGYAYGYFLARRALDPTYQLFAIIQTGPEKEALKSSYLSELLGLSADQPVNLYAFDCAAARRRLLASPLIKAATVKTYLPGTVYVDYAVRKPVAYLRDYSNTAVDGEGILIPCEPFFTPKRIPMIYLGLPAQENVWGRSIQGTKLSLALAVRDQIDQALPREETSVKLIDVSQAEATSFGQREIIITLEERFEGGDIQSVILRLDPAHYPQALANYAILRTHLAKSPPKSRIVDLRVPHLAFVQ
jgi:hypothetical protein